MKATLNSIKRKLRQLRGFFPQALPTGKTEFAAWADMLMDTYSLPTQDRDSIHFALSTMIMHLGPTDAYKANWYFILAICSGCAKQVAGQTFQDVKLRQKAAAEAALEAKANEPQES